MSKRTVNATPEQEAEHRRLLEEINSTAPERNLPINHPEYPEGDVRRHWPIFEDTFGFGTDHSDLLVKAAEIDAREASLAKAQKLSLPQALGYSEIELDGEVYFVKSPKIKKLIEFQSRIEEYDSLSEAERNSAQGIMLAVAAVSPMLRRFDLETHKLVTVTADEAAEVMDPEDIGRVFELAFPNMKAGQELAKAGIVDPKAPRRKMKTGE